MTRRTLETHVYFHFFRLMELICST